jgi:hypothetical protein
MNPAPISCARCTRDAEPLLARAFALESLEQRKMLSVYSYVNSYLSALSGFAYFAEVRLGDNGAPGVAGVCAGASYGDSDSALIQWDENLGDGLDSDWKDVSLSLSAASTNELGIDVGQTAGFAIAGTALSQIHQVTIRAAVTGADMAFMWRDLMVYFYSDDGLIAAESLSSGPSVNTIDAQTNDAAESVTVISTDADDCVSIVISGQLRLIASQSAAAGAYDIFGQVLIQ